MMMTNESHDEGRLRVIRFTVSLGTSQSHFCILGIDRVLRHGSDAIRSTGSSVDPIHQSPHSIRPSLALWTIGTGPTGRDDEGEAGGTGVGCGGAVVRGAIGLPDRLGVEMGSMEDFLTPIDDDQEGGEDWDEDDSNKSWLPESLRKKKETPPAHGQIKPAPGLSLSEYLDLSFNEVSDKEK